VLLRTGREEREREQVEEEGPDAATKVDGDGKRQGDHEEAWMASVLIDAACAFLAGTKE